MRSDSAWVAGHKAASRTVWIGFLLTAAAGVLALVTSGGVAIAADVAVVLVLFATVAIAIVKADRATTPTAQS